MRVLHIKHLWAALMIAALLAVSVGSAAAQTPVKSIGTGKNINCKMTYSQLKNSGTPYVALNKVTFFIGYRQVTSINKNPVLIRFDGWKRTFCRTSYEVTGDDSTGYGLYWNGSKALYAVFSSTGTQGTSSQDFRRFATKGWLKSYGSGGGAKIAIVARVLAANGNVTHATFLSARKSDGKSNSLTVKDLSFANAQLTVRADSWFSPRKADRTAYACTGSSPFDYEIVFDAGLTKAISTQVYNDTDSTCTP